MKKFLAIVVALILALTLTAAMAEAAPELNWSDIEPALEAGGVAGQFYTFDEIAVKIWLPEGFNPVELTQEDVDAGYIGYFQPEDKSATVAIMYVNVDGMTIDDYAESLSTMEDVTEVEKGTVNGLPCVNYQMPEQDSLSIAFATEAGYMLELTCVPMSEENADLVWGAVIASIQAA